MHYPYAPGDLVLIEVWPAFDGGYTAVYDLPAPRLWLFHRYAGEGDTFVEVGTDERSISRVRIAIGPAMVSNLEGTLLGTSSAVVVPYYRGEEDIFNTVIFWDVPSVEAVLYRMGYAPILSAN